MGRGLRYWLLAGSWGWLVHFRAQTDLWVGASADGRQMAVEMGGWVCKISNFQDTSIQYDSFWALHA